MNANATELKLIIENKSPFLAERIVDLQYKANPVFWEKYGEIGRQISIRDAGYHLPFLTEAILAEDEKIFTEYVAWVKVLFQGLNFPDTVMINTLKYTLEVLKEELNEKYHDIITAYIQAGIDQMNKPVMVMETYIEENTKIGQLTRKYIDALLDGNRHLASKLILDAVQNGTSVKQIYLEVFQKSQYEIGRLWLSNQISVAKEHFCSAATQLIMSQLYPFIFNTERIGRSIVAASIGGELHEIGVRMVADFFEMHGWDAYYMGANTPASSIIKAVEENNADIVGLSVAMPYHRSSLEDVVQQIKKSSISESVKIMIGGNAFNRDVNSWQNYNVDGFAPDAEKAIEVAGWLLESK